MSVGGSLVCYECQNELRLGDRRPPRYDLPVEYYVDGEPDWMIWSNPAARAAVSKFLAYHVGHRLSVLLEESSLDAFESMSHFDSYFDIGGRNLSGVTIEDYLRDFDETKRYRDLNASDTFGIAAGSGFGPPGFLVCIKTLERIRLGWPYRSRGRIRHFFLESSEKLSDDIPRMQAVFKFFAANTEKPLRVMLEDELHELLLTHPNGREIGGTEAGDVSFEKYLTGWTGLDLVFERGSP